MSELNTPCLLLNKTALERNVDTMQKRLARLGVRSRPHLKTCKSLDVARMLDTTHGATVSTLREAEYFFDGGITDLTYAVGLAPNKIGRVAALLKKGARLSVVLDSVSQAKNLAAWGDRFANSLSVLIEIDSDGHRSGVAPDNGELLRAIVGVLEDRSDVVVRGVLTHAGESYTSATSGEIREYAHRERDAANLSAAVLRDAGVDVTTVSVGSTPTATFADDLTGITEVRTGVYMFQDLVMAGLGVCDVNDIALSVLCSVIGHQRDRNWLIVDAGWTALSRDRGTSAQAVDQGYGLVCSVDGVPVDDLIVKDTNQEHGIVTCRNGGVVDCEKYPVGTLLRILPNHACATASMHTAYRVLDDSGVVEAAWPRCSGW